MKAGAEVGRLAVIGQDAPVTACLISQLLAGRGRIGLVAVRPRPGAAEEAAALYHRLEQMGCDEIVLALPECSERRNPLEELHFETVVLASGGVRAGALLERSRRVVLNWDDPDCRALRLPERTERFTCSERQDAVTVAAKNLRALPYQTQFEAVSGEEIVRISVPLPGGAGLYPGLLAVTAGLAGGMTLRQCAGILREASPVPDFEQQFSGAGGFVAAGYFQPEIEREQKI